MAGLFPHDIAIVQILSTIRKRENSSGIKSPINNGKNVASNSIFEADCRIFLSFLTILISMGDGMSDVSVYPKSNRLKRSFSVAMETWNLI